MVETDILIVGAGPTGLTLAGDLAARGVSVTVIERRAQEANTTRAFAVHARTMEQLDARGLAEELAATGAHVDSLRLFGHARLSLADLPTRFPYLLVTPQYQVERVLERRALAAGAQILRGARLTGFDQDAVGVTARIERAQETGETVAETLRAAYLVGTDGVHSTVREQLGLDFPGVTVLSSIMLADVRLAEPPQDVLNVSAVAEGFVFMAPFGDGWHRIFAWDRANQQPDSAPVDLEEVRSIVRAAFGTDYGMGEARWVSRFHSDERQAPHYRVGRVFLAGDAAHCHSPAGGQGMNTGIQDAVNLGWKLAAAVRGHAPDGLLDTYEAERHPIGKQVLRSSGAIIRAGMLRPFLKRHVRDAAANAALHVRPIARRITGTVTGIGFEYGRPHGAHQSVGKRITDWELTDADGAPTRVYEQLRSNRFVLVGRGPVVAGAVDGWKELVVCAQAAGDSGTEGLGAATLTLVRPDGYIAWATDETDPQRRDSALASQLTAWCGPAQ